MTLMTSLTLAASSVMPSRSAVRIASPSVSLTAALAVVRSAPETAVPVLVLIAANVVPTGPTWPELSTSGVTPTDSAARFDEVAGLD